MAADDLSLCDSAELQPAREHDVRMSEDPEQEQTTGKLGPFNINMDLLPMKFYYLFFFGARACVGPFLPVFYRYMGMSARQTGVITGLDPLVSFVSKPFWGAVADKGRKHKKVMVVILIVSSLLMFSIVFLPRSASPVTETTCSPTACGSINMTVNPSWCFVYLEGLKSILAEDNNEVFLHEKCRNNILQCSAPGDLFTALCSSNMCREMCNETASYEDILEVEKHLLGIECALLKPFLQCIGIKENCTETETDSGAGCCRFLHTENFKPGSNYSLCLQKFQHFGANLTFPENKTKDFEIGAVDTSGERSNSKMFLLLLVIILTSRFFRATDSMVDAVVVKYLSKTGKQGNYGKQRLWGGVGWGVVSILAGLGIDESAGYQKQNQFIIPFCGFLALNIFTVICMCKLKAEVLLDGQSRPNILRNLRVIATSYHIMTFLLAILVMGVCFGMVNFYLFWFLQDLGGSHLLMGLALAMTCATEVPIMFFSGYLIKFLGHHGVLYLAFVCYSIRFASYSFIPNAWYVLAIEPLHGVTYGALWATATSYGGQIAPPGMAATVIGLISAVHSGLGSVIAGLAGGMVYSIYGARATFQGIAVMTIVSCVLFAISQEIPKCIGTHIRKSGSDALEYELNRQELHVMISEDDNDDGMHS